MSRDIVCNDALTMLVSRNVIRAKGSWFSHEIRDFIFYFLQVYVTLFLSYADLYVIGFPIPLVLLQHFSKLFRNNSLRSIIAWNFPIIFILLDTARMDIYIEIYIYRSFLISEDKKIFQFLNKITNCYRYLAVVHPISSMSWRTENHAIVAICIAWAMIFAISTPAFFVHGEVSPNSIID